MTYGLNEIAPLSLTFGERASTAGIVTLEGMAVVFLVLSILWGMIEIMHRLLNGKKKKAESEPVRDSVPAPTSAEEPIREDDGALVAAITAAIAASMAEEGNTGAFRVVSFRRAAGKKRN